MIDNDILAILENDPAVHRACGAPVIQSYPDMTDDDIVRVLRDERRDAVSAATMGNQDSAPRRSLSRNGDIGIADYRALRCPADDAADPEYAGARTFRVNAGAQCSRSAIRKARDEDDGAVSSALSVPTIT